MQFYSTKNANLKASGTEAIVRGLAPDGGLYLPSEFRAFPMEKLSRLTGEEISVKVLASLFEEFDEKELSECVRAAYSENFENGDISPLVPVGDAWSMELFHGPTCAFKDVALCLLPHLLTRSMKKCGIKDEVCILTATSGDTGSAALFGFSDVKGTKIIVFYPDGGVSPMQRKQMVTCPGKNTSVTAVKGNFDDAQTGVKAIFAAPPEVSGVRFSSANSINIGRLAPQIAYYFKAYHDLMNEGKIRLGDKVNFVVPTGNFGDILAGYFAKKMGLPVGKLVCASNENRVLTDFFETGVYDRRREFRLTSSPSMDILISSNLERLISMTVGTEKCGELMNQLKETGVYTLEDKALKQLKQEFSAGYADDKETRKTIRETFEKFGYLMDPHTAVAHAVYNKWKKSAEGNDLPTVILSTASPYKFTKAVLEALGQVPTADEYENLVKLSDLTKTAIPAALSRLADAEVKHPDGIAVSEMQEFVKIRAGK
ncbi:MAG: threonine synthase [Clostridia bacterium]|nr:threonine synthase [Clostridia bacterium]